MFGEGGGRKSKKGGKNDDLRKWFVDKTRSNIEILKRKLDNSGKTE